MIDFGARSTMAHIDGPIMAECPKCRAEQEDHDGLGVLHCFECGYCTHAAVNGRICSLCGLDVSREHPGE